jgi:hypothetical protein
MRTARYSTMLAVAAIVCVCAPGCEEDSNVTPIGEAALTGYSNTPHCVRGGDVGEAEGDYPDDPPRVEVLTDGLQIEIIHQNAWFNCCLDTILVDLRQERRQIILTESEVVTMPCRCICPFRVTASLEASLPGKYGIEIYALEGLIWTGEVMLTPK